MCFSPTVSFATAAVTGAVGMICMLRTENPRELPLAAIPVVFSVQQAIEGVLWLTLPAAPGGASASGLALAFLLIAEVLWPVYAPFAALRAETVPWRQRTIAVCLAAGAGVAGTLLWDLLSGPHTASVIDRHVVYVTARQPSPALGLGYLAATGLSLLLSSQRAVALVGVLVLVGSVVAYLFYWDSFTSVWCFFAAAAAIVLLGHFEWSRRRTADA